MYSGATMEAASHPVLHPIFFFNPDTPGAIWQDKPQIARRLAATNTVVHVGPEPYLRPLLEQARAGHFPLSDLRRPALVHTQDNLYTFTWSPLAPVTGAPGLQQLAAALRRRRWQAVLRELHAERPILWLFRPGQQRFIDEFDEADGSGRSKPGLVIYHVVDEYSAYPTLTTEQAAQQKQLDLALTARADLVFCTARSLVEARRPINSNTHYLPNAVDYRAFQQMLADPLLHPPAGMAVLPRPILGVIGGINAKLDLALLIGLAERRADWSLALVGPLSYGLDAAEVARLRGLANVHFFGAVPPEQVPVTTAACDVCLIPYRLNEQTRHVNPLKVYEYLAAGKPVVATALPEVGQFGGSVRVSGGDVESGGWRVESFVEAVEAALAEGDDPVAVATRRALAAANTWDHRVAKMLVLIEATLAAREKS
jgi:glycosyltransferase involved in cell wall biosynthesis